MEKRCGIWEKKVSQLDIEKKCWPEKEIEYRNLKDIDYTDFVLDTENSPLAENYESMTSVIDLSHANDSTLRSRLDIHAPLKKKTTTFRPSSLWFTDEIGQLELRNRRMERRWHLSKLQTDRGCVHTKPDKFENATFAAKTDTMFSVHINCFQTVSLSTLKRCPGPRTLARESRS